MVEDRGVGQVGVGGGGMEDVREPRVRKDRIVNVLLRFKIFCIKIKGYTVMVKQFSGDLSGDITV